jgi:polysaccharide export outer membrane protein
MNKLLGTISRVFTVLALVSTLGACAFAPGMRFDASRQLDPDDPNSVPEVKQITPSLVVRDNNDRAQMIDESYRAFLGKPEPYVIGPGDILSVVVWDHPELVLPTQTYSIGTGPAELTLGDQAAGIPGYPVAADGTVQFPYVGVVKVAGLTEAQARALLVRRSGDYIQNPQITVRILGYRSKRVYVDGEVKTPGAVAITDTPMTVAEALNRAGGMLTTADRSSIYISRNGVTTRLDTPRLQGQKVDIGMLMLKSGDLVRVLSRADSQVFVMGEVTRPAPVSLKDGRLSLSEALGEVGGPSQLTSNPSQIFVVRSQPSAIPIIYHLDATSASAMGVAEKFALQPKDVVFVDAGNLVRWNRFISLLLPSAQTVQTTDSVRR